MAQPSFPDCQNAEIRKNLVLDSPDLNGIDFIEVDAADHSLLRVFFIKPVAPANPVNPADTNDALGLSADPSKITITGGVRLVGVRIVSVTRRPAGFLEVRVNFGGDFSEYILEVNAPGLDTFLRRIAFSFTAACPTDFDCRPPVVCPPRNPVEPLLDYLVKDYAGFRQFMLDLLPQLNPNFTERNPADLGIALIELLAYTADRLSYFQDAVENEAYLDTLRRRISARRHTRLIDYKMHDGRNAWTHLFVEVNAAANLVLGTKVVSRLQAPLAGTSAPPGPVVDPDRIDGDALDHDPALAGALVFETTENGQFDPKNNEIVIHTFGNEECCLAAGDVEAFLFSVAGGTANVPVLNNGDFLLFEERVGPVTGLEADADLARRQIVQIDEDPEVTEDPLFKDTLTAGELIPRAGAGPALPLLRVHWRRQDALQFKFCLSTRPPVGPLLRNVSVARGNLVLCDHGLTVEEVLTPPGPVQANGRPFTLQLSRAPLTIQCAPDQIEFDALTNRPTTPRVDLTCDARDARAAVFLLATFPTGQERFTGAPDLLNSPPFDQKFVAEVDNTGRAILRFGDGEYGRDVAGATSFDVFYRIGNGAAGNAGAESLEHIAPPNGSAAASAIVKVRNPLAATGGVEAETIGEVRSLAPDAFRAVQFRAVTEADYKAAAVQLPEVASAVATFRWTGSWYTVFVGIDPRDSGDLIQLPNGRTRLAPALQTKVTSFLKRFKLAGYDLEIRPPIFVALELDIEVCVKREYFRGDVAKAVTDALSNRVLPGGQLGFFHPDNFSFGQAVYLSRIYAAVEAVEGVDSAVVTTFQRFGQTDNGELAAGVLTIGPWEIAQLDNDRNFMEHGVLKINALGGKL